MKQFEFRLNRITAIKEKDLGGDDGSDPYIWVCYFYVDANDLFTEEPVRTYVPTYDSFRSSFPNNVSDGQVLTIPATIGSYSAKLHTGSGTSAFYMAGCVVVMLDENQTSLEAMKAGRNAFAAGIHRELNTLIKSRISSLDTADLREEEVEEIQNVLQSQINSSVKDKLSLWSKLFDSQDKSIGTTYCAFMPDNFLNTPLIDFPDIIDGATVAESNNQFRLEGSFRQWNIIVRPDIEIGLNCNTNSKAVADQQLLVKTLLSELRSLQERLRKAPASQKPGIVSLIRDLKLEMRSADELLGELMDDLAECEDRIRDHGIFV